MIKAKNKICVECGRDDQPWFSKRRCKSCASKGYGKPKPVSKKRGKELAVYSKLRELFLKKNQMCQAKLEGCTGVATEVHHTAGRENEKLNDDTRWKAICRGCHNRTTFELSAEENRELGLRV